MTCTPNLLSTICNESWDFTPPSSPGDADTSAATLPEGKPLGRLIQSRAFLRSAVYILAGKLVCLSEHSLRVAYCHYAVYPMASESTPAMVPLRHCLVEQACAT